MAESGVRSPKSSLAASRANAAPWGIPVPVKPKPQATASTSIPLGGARPLTAGAVRSAPAAVRTQTAATSSATPAPRQRSTDAGVRAIRSARVRSASEQRVIALLIAAAVGMLLALSAMGAQAKFSSSASERVIGSTLGRASLAQMEFRARHERYALWEELEANGMRLPEDVSVLRSNATTSHWYLRLLDRKTGVTCERLGQLIDGPMDAAVPNCSRAR